MTLVPPLGCLFCCASCAAASRGCCDRFVRGYDIPHCCLANHCPRRQRPPAHHQSLHPGQLRASPSLSRCPHSVPGAWAHCGPPDSTTRSHCLLACQSPCALQQAKTINRQRRHVANKCPVRACLSLIVVGITASSVCSWGRCLPGAARWMGTCSRRTASAWQVLEAFAEKRLRSTMHPRCCMGLLPDLVIAYNACAVSFAVRITVRQLLQLEHMPRRTRYKDAQQV